MLGSSVAPIGEKTFSRQDILVSDRSYALTASRRCAGLDPIRTGAMARANRLGGAFMPARRAEVHEDSWAHGKRTGVIP